MGTLRFVLSIVLGVALTYGVQRWDRSYLTPEQRQRGWNGTTWAAALYAFGPFSMLGWAWVTRQEVRRWRRQSRSRALVWSVGLLLNGLAVALLITGTVEKAVELVAGTSPEP